MRLFIVSILLLGCSKSTPDTTAPQIVVESPEPASFSDTDQVLVTGVVIDDSPVTLTINEEKVKLDEGRFSYRIGVPDLALIEIKAVDESENSSNAILAVSRTSEKEAMEWLNDGLMIRSVDSTFGPMSDRFADDLQKLDLGATIQNNNPVYEWGGGALGADVHLDTLTFNVDSLEISRDGDKLITVGSFSTINSTGRIHQSVSWIKSWKDYVATADSAIFRAEWKIKKLEDETFVFDPQHPEFDLTNFEVDSSFLIEAADFFIGFEGEIENAMRTEILDTIAADLSKQIQTLNIDAELKVFQSNHQLDAVTSKAQITDDGVVLGLKSQTNWVGAEPQKIYTAKRPAKTNEEKIFKQDRGFYPSFDLSSDDALQLALHENFVNQILSSVWNSRSLDKRYDVSAEQGSISHINLLAPLPPIVSANESTDGETGFLLRAGALELELFVRGKEDMALKVRVNLESVGNARWNTEFKRPELYLSSLELTPEILYIADDFFNEDQADAIIDIVEPQLQDVLNGVLANLLLPSLLDLEATNMKTTGSGAYIMIHSDLSYSPTTN